MTDKQIYSKQAKENKSRWYDHNLCPYIPEGDKYPSVTTILSVIAKPLLYAWYQQNGTKKAEIIWGQLSDEIKRSITLDEDFWLSGMDKSDKAKDIGSIVHDLIEFWARNDKWPEYIPDEAHNAIQAFKEFVENHKLEVIDVEVNLASREHKYAGRTDIIGKIDGVLGILDIKTSSGFYPEMGLQLSAYQKAYEEMTGNKVEERWIIRLDKKTGKLETKQYEDSFETFLHAKGLWEGLR